MRFFEGGRARRGNLQIVDKQTIMDRMDKWKMDRMDFYTRARVHVNY